MRKRVAACAARMDIARRGGKATARFSAFAASLARSLLGLTLALALVSEATAQSDPAITNGLNWLQAQIQSDGRVAGEDASEGMAQQVRSETAITLNALGRSVPSPLAALTSSDTSGAEALARGAVAAPSNGASLDLLKSFQFGDGGVAPMPGFQASALDTAWALRALNGRSFDADSAIGWLAARQHSSGAWLTEPQAPVFVTATILRGLRDASARNTTAATAAAAAANYLTSVRQSNGSWGGSIWLTALVYEAVHDFSVDPTLSGSVRDWLISRQGSDGSWGGDPYVTAIALRALALTAVPAHNPTQATFLAQVVDSETGAPLAGASLALTGATPRSATSDATGTFNVSGISAGAYNGTFSANGYASLLVSVTLPADTTTNLGKLQMSRSSSSSATAATLSGMVLDSATRMPLTGVNISLAGSGLQAQTDGQGKYIIAAVPPGSYTASASKSGYVSSSIPVVAFAGKEYVFSPALTAISSNTGSDVQGCRIFGTVARAADGAPLSGVAVSLVGANSRSSLTDASGAYLIGGLLSGSTTITVAAPGYDIVSSTLTLACGNAPSALSYSPRLYATGTSPAGANTASVTFTLVDASSDSPLSGITVTATPLGASGRSLVTGPDGRFTVDKLQAASVQIDVNASGFDPLSLSYAVEPLQAKDLGQLRLRRSGSDPLLPDLKVLKVTRSGAVTDAQTLRVNGSVQATIQNAGRAAVGQAVQVLAFLDVNLDGRFDPAVDMVLGQISLDPLQVGQSVALSIPVAGTLPFRDAPIHVFVDANQQLAEINKTNNVKSTADAAEVLPAIGSFNPVLKWKWDGSTSPYPGYNQVTMSPVVGRLLDTNGDGRIDERDDPIVAFTAWSTAPVGSYNKDGVIRLLNGRNGQELLAIKDPTAAVGGVANLAIADLDGDGKPEIIAIKLDGGLVVFRNNGQKWWDTPPLHPFNWTSFCPCSSWGAPHIADLDADGKPEVIFGRYVYSYDGRLKWVATTNYWGGFGNAQSPMSIAADLNLTGQQNVIIGPSAFASDGRLLWSNGSVPDGFTAIGNFHGGQYPEIVVAGNGKLSLLNHEGALIWQVPIPGASGSSNFGGPPVIADVDGDGVPDIGVANATRYTVFRADGSVMWSVPTQDSSSYTTGSTVFDFAGDGRSEVLYGDEVSIKAFLGAQGTAIWNIPNSTATTHEYPIVVDLDSDGHADLVTIANDFFTSIPNTTVRLHGIRVFQDQNNSWVNTRQVWNQHAYSITNVNDDLTIPAHPRPSWQVHNTYRANKRLDIAPTAVADATASYVRVLDFGGTQSSRITVRVGNAGALGTPLGLKVAFYAGNAGGAPLGVVATSRALNAGEYEDVSLSIADSLAAYSSLIAVVDDDGHGAHAITDFDRTNNTITADLSTIALNVRVEASTDKAFYTDADQAILTGLLTNSGSFARQVQVRFTILDASGAQAQVLALPAIASVDAGTSAAVRASWPASGVLSGNYQLLVELVNPQGLVYGSSTASFAVQTSATQSGGTRILTDRVSYSASQLVQVTDAVVNLTGNTLLDGVQAITTITNAAGASVFNKTEAVSQLAPGGQRQYSYSVAAGTLAAGSYVASIKLVNVQGQVLSQSSANFSVLGTDATGVGVTGQLTAPPSILVGQPVAMNLSATNGGSASLSNVPVTIRVIDPASGSMLTSTTQTIASWAQGGTQLVSWNWTSQGVDGQTVVAAATVNIAGRDVPIGQANIRLIGVPKLAMQPAQLNFAAIYVGEAAPAQTVTVSSVGTATASTITAVLTGMDPSQFVITNNTCDQAASLAVGASCAFSVAYRPTTLAQHAAQAKVSYAAGEDLIVPLTGQAKPAVFTAGVSADPNPANTLSQVSLSYSLTNPAAVSEPFTGTLQVINVAGQTLASWPITTTVAANATSAGNQSFTTPSDAQTLMVSLSQVLGTATATLSSTSLTVTGADASIPVGFTGSLQGQARVLVLVSCPPGLGAAEDAACVQARSVAIANYLTALGYQNKVVATGDDFLAQMRCGPYNIYWISGGAIKLASQTAEELREEIWRGKALWTDGVHDARNAILYGAQGVTQVGKLPAANQSASMLDGGLYGAGSFATLGTVTKFRLTTGRAQGQFTQVPGEQAPVPAVVANTWGQGNSLLFAFDLAAMITQDANRANAALANFVITSAGYAATATPTLTIGDVTLLQAGITNQGASAVTLQVIATLPAGLTSISTAPNAQMSTDGSVQASWTFASAAGSTQTIHWQVRAAQPGSYSVPFTVYSVPLAGGTPQLRQSGSIDVLVKDAASLLQQAQVQVNALRPTASNDKENLIKAQAAIAQARSYYAQGNWEAAITQWIAAADQVQAITSIDVSAARTAIAIAIEATSDAACVQKCGSAGCQ